mmetsp:Transcript_13647/g.18192  ORF Transcript_13647/g.18192 Transcript_13647/m.18192 type:complete len:492 (+) Transcript_13647:44-1519(+)
MSACTASIADASIEDGFCAALFAGAFERARGLDVDGEEILVLERGQSQIVALFDEDDDGIAEKRNVIGSADGLNHGLVLNGNDLYASSATTVYRWKYEGSGGLAKDRKVIVSGIPGSGHVTRTLLIENNKWLYISVGSRSNVDEDSSRSNVRRCDLSLLSNDVEKILDFESECELFADGLRNEVGLAMDRYSILWGVENAADRLSRDDLGGSSASNDNPAEELNRLVLNDKGQPQHYGYPYCFTEYLLDPEYGLGRGTIWSWPGAEGAHGYDDESCRNSTTPPILAMQGHSAPLGITFYDFSQIHHQEENCQGTFPEEYDGNAFVAFHGSWNREEPTGYKVVRIPMDESGPIVDDPIDFLKHNGPSARWPSGFRPVDVKFDHCGRLLVSSDGTRSGTEYSEGVIVRICFGACGGGNYTEIWNGGSGNEPNEWYEKSNFVAYLATVAGVLLLICLCSCLFLFRRFRSRQQRWAYSKSNTNKATDDKDSNEDI